MNKKILILLPMAGLLAGCETLQTPQQRRETTARQQNATRHTEEQVHRLKGKVETAEVENARLMQEMQQLRSEVRAANANIAQLNSNMKTLEAKQAREMNELIKRVEALIKTAVSRPPSNSRPPRGSGREHVVDSGHTLSAIASAYGTTVKAIKDANNLKSDTIRVGQTLFIPD